MWDEPLSTNSIIPYTVNIGTYQRITPNFAKNFVEPATKSLLSSFLDFAMPHISSFHKTFMLSF
jgi:hypothetical protein